MPDPATRSCLGVVLAAGEGKRMKSALPKVMHAVAGRSMLAHVLAAVREAGAGATAVIVGPGRDDVAAEAKAAAPDAEIFVQNQRLGTAHAVLAGEATLMRGHDDVVVAFADTPLVTAATFSRLRSAVAEGAAVAVLAFEAADPAGYGRVIVRDGLVEAIVEHRDASEEQRRVTLCNAGLMAVSGREIAALLRRIGNANAQGEYYLTDLVAVARSAGLHCAVVVAQESEVMGVNDRVQLAAAEGLMQERLRRSAMLGGATLIDPATVRFSHDTRIGQDVIVEPYVFFGPKVTVEDGAVIHAHSHLEGAHVGAGAHVGPYARLRPGAALKRGAKVGNFVEIKAATIGEGAKVSHLTYIGDASIGAGANIGAGTITCNYDGFSKHRTVIGAGAFIGSNSALVAPVTIGEGAYVGSGSVVTKDVEADALAVSRARQVNLAGWAAGFRQKRAKPA